MNQLDRLEALAEKLKPRHELELEGLDFEVEELLEALPDLIQVARAARDLVAMPLAFDTRAEPLREALVPLYREVES